MGFLDEAMSEDYTEPTAVPGDTEYKLRIVDVKVDPSTPDGLPRDKNGNAYLMPRFEILNEPTAKEFGRYMAVPNADMDAKKRNSCGFSIKQFFSAFDLDSASLNDPLDMVGSEGWAILGLEDNEQYGEQNYVKKFIVAK